MIATRGLKPAVFGVGERVLCFEPDPTKVRVLYDSKILKVDWTRDEGGKRVPEYLVHFNGWNHSWDRWAPENFILKYTDDNLELQEKLQKEAEEKMRKKRRKRTWSEILEEAKLKREKLAKENNASSTEGSYDDNSVSSDSDDESDEEAVEVPITFPEALYAKLEDDCYFITTKQMLVQLPPENTALAVMETYLRDFAYRCQAHNVRVHVRQQGTAGMPGSLASANTNNGDSITPPPLPQYNVDLCREVMDGIRILFDFLLPTNLLYDCERAQHRQLYAQRQISSNSPKEGPKTKLTVNGSVKTTRRRSLSPSKETPPILEPQTPGPNDPPPILKPEPLMEEKEEKEEREPAPAKRVTRRSSTSNYNQPTPTPATRELRSSDNSRRRSTDAKPVSAHKREDTDAKETVNHQLPIRNVRHSARLASHSSSSSASSPPIIPNMDSIPSLEASTVASEPTLPVAGSSPTRAALSNGDADRAVKPRDKASSAADVGKIPQMSDVSIKQEEGTTDDRVFSIEKNCWKLLPDNANYNGAEPPCRVYGAQHLLRLFVKLPEMLGRMELPPKKLKPLVKHIEMFLRWLSATDQLLEYFPDKAYINAADIKTDIETSRGRRSLVPK
ncbi:MSL complex subunit 3-like [Diadema antillarum]|uniref:MSL complex subunit 3-like n=1 Tax=Diadema antillarum TaxID=105358 RepID=UPI003A86EA44